MFRKCTEKVRRCSTSGCPFPIQSGTVPLAKKRVSLFGGEPIRKEKCLPFQAIPGPKPSLPFIGTGWQYFRWGRYNLADLHSANVDKFKRYGPVVKEEFRWRKPMVHLYDPADIETMFRSQGVKPVRPIQDFVKLYRNQRPEKYESPGLAATVGEEWLHLRHSLSPALMRLNSLEGLLPSLNSVCDDFAQLIRHERDATGHRIENLQEILYRFSMEGIYMMTMETRLGGLQPNLQANTSAFKMIHSVKLLFESFHELLYGLPLWKIFNTKSYQKMDTAESVMYEVTKDRIQELMEKLRKQSTNPNSEMPGLLHRLLNTKGLSDKEIRVTIIDLLSGGVFTVTNAFSFLLYNMARNPRVQEKACQELQRIAPDGVITKERLAKLCYLKACLKESFRLTPTIPGIARILPQDMVASGYHIPAGTSVFSNFMVACQHPGMFPDPEQFHPERWLDENRNINPFAMVPFGFGYRMCVGRRFAEMEMHTALAKMIHNFKLEGTGQIIGCKQTLIVIPSQPVSIIFKDRCTNSPKSLLR